MRKLLFAIIIIGLHTNYSLAQTINDIPIKNIDVEYIQIVGKERFMSKKISIELDFGQKDKNFTSKEFTVKDKNGDKVKFNSMIDALNFISKNGYEYVDSYALTDGKESVISYLMRKKH